MLSNHKNGVIFYSLGNFIFDQETKETNMGLAVGFVYRDGAKEFYLFPYDIIHAQPQLMPYPEMKKFCDNILSDITTSDTCQFSL